jgi:Flp pilus assembly protein TadG
MMAGRQAGAAARLRRQRGGAAALEFALAVTPLLLLLLGTIEGGLLLWSWQALEGAVIDAGRCAALDATSCQNAATTPSNTASYAASAAQLRGLSSVTASNVTVSTGTTAKALCGNTTASVVTVSIAYKFSMISLIPLPSTLTVAACFPLS